MTKQEAFDLLCGIRSGCIYGLVLNESVSLGLVSAIIRGRKFGFEHNDGSIEGVDLTVLADQLDDPAGRRTIRGNLVLMLKQKMIAQSYEVIYEYCERTKQLAKLQAWPPYNFVRLVRHVYSHNDGAVLKWQITPKQASWRHRTITKDTDDGKELLLNPAEVILLSQDMADFFLSLDG